MQLNGREEMNTIKVSVNELTMLKDDMMRKNLNSARFMNESIGTESARHSIDGVGNATLSERSNSRSPSLFHIEPTSLRVMQTGGNQQADFTDHTLPYL